MNNVNLCYAFLDESGGTAPTQTSHILVVAVILTREPNEIKRIIHRFQKKKGYSQASGELKTRKLEPAKIKQVLERLAHSAIQVVAVIVDPFILNNPPSDPEEIYRWAVACAIRHVVERYPHVEIVLDRRYTKEALRFELEKSIRQALVGFPDQYVLIRQDDSLLRNELQAVDFLAWALFQKYEKNKLEYYKLIAPLVIKEECLSNQRWDTWQLIENDRKKKIPRAGG